MSDNDIQQRLVEIEKAINILDRRLESYVVDDEKAHGIVRAEVGQLDRRQERLEAKMDSFFDSVANLKDELSKMNLNLVTYNSQLAEHMRRTAINEERLDRMEEEARRLTEKHADAHQEVERLKIISSTIVKVFIAIGGTIGFVYTAVQLIEKLHK